MYTRKNKDLKRNGNKKKIDRYNKIMRTNPKKKILKS